MTLSPLAIFSAILLMAVVTRPLTKHAYIPQGAILVLAGFLCSELIIALGLDTGLRWNNFSPLILELLLPILVFAIAINTPLKNLQRHSIAILFLAIPVMLISTFCIGLLLYYGIGYPASFPWPAALLAGCILSATDPSAVSHLLKTSNQGNDLGNILEGESLFNDSAAVVLYMFFLGLLLQPDNTPDIGQASLSLLYTLIGALVLGFLISSMVKPLYRHFQDEISRSLLMLTALLASLYCANQLLNVSAIVTVLVAGLLLGKLHRQLHGQSFTTQLWELISHITNSLIFVLAGATITLLMFTSNWLAIFIGIAAALFARALSIYCALPVLSLTPGAIPFSMQNKHALSWGGLRGTVALALALSLPLELESQIWFTIQSIAYGVVLFSLLIQAPTMSFLVKKLGHKNEQT